jgi:hypothetical protein
MSADAAYVDKRAERGAAAFLAVLAAACSTG